MTQVTPDGETGPHRRASRRPPARPPPPTRGSAPAARLYLWLYPDPEALAAHGDAVMAHRVVRSIGEAGDPDRALELLKPLLHRLHLTAGNTHWLTQEATETRDELRRVLREDRRSERGAGLARLFGR
ncbi:hypothetical protein AB0D46_35525 [Streptomyces sp. NPDC048383]|uniref:hypothetical protein n=1 Tax=Streptomyces sp. NPDC048383 TaxID=3155386 RepID=UPI0034350BDD